MFLGRGQFLPNDFKGDSMVMFEEVLNKSFEIIRNMLPRLNSLYQLNEQLERSVSNVERKLTRLELDHEDLHYELRTNKIAFECKMESLSKQCSILTNETISSKKHGTRSRHERREQSCDQAPSKSASKHRTRKIVFEDELIRQIGKPSSRKNSIDLEEENVQIPSKVQFNHSNVSIDLADKTSAPVIQKHQFASQSHVTNNIHNQPAHVHPNFNSAKSIKCKEKEGQNFPHFLKEIQHYHRNHKMSNNYQKLLAKYIQQTNTQFQELQFKINQITIKISQINRQKIEVKSIQNYPPFTQVDSFHDHQTVLVKLNSKVDIFEKTFKEFNDRLASLHQAVRRSANKEETSRAIQCLQHKLNSIMLDRMPSQNNKIHQNCLHTVEIGKNGVKSVSSQEHSLQSKRTLRQGQDLTNSTLTPTLTPTPTLRNQNKSKQYATTSLHCNVAVDTTKRLNQIRTSLIIDRPQKMEDATVRPSLVKDRQVKLLKQKSAAILEYGKDKVRPKLKKERLIFEYD